MTKLNSRQKGLLYGTAAVVAVAGASWGAYAYVTSAPQRAEKQYDAAMKLMASGKYPDAIKEFTSAAAT